MRLFLFSSPCYDLIKVATPIFLYPENIKGRDCMNLDYRNLQTKECKELCVMLYFKVLYEIACEFTCTGGEVAKIPNTTIDFGRINF